MKVNDPAATYNQLVSRIRTAFIKGIEASFEVGQAVELAKHLGKTVQTVAVDTGHSAAKLQRLHRVYVFWGSDRIPGCSTFYHYDAVAVSGDLTRKALLIKRGDKACVKTTRNASGVTQMTGQKIVNIGNTVNSALVLLRGLQVRLTADQTTDLLARIDVLRQITVDKGVVAKTAGVPSARARKPAQNVASNPGLTQIHIRKWAEANGFLVGRAGRLSTVIVDAYNAAHAA